MASYIIVPAGVRAQYLESGMPGASRLAKAFKARTLAEAKKKADRLSKQTGGHYVVYGGITGKLVHENPQRNLIPAKISIDANGRTRVFVTASQARRLQA